MTSPLLFVWGDDDLIAERVVGRFATALASEGGSPLERWDVRADRTSAGIVASQLAERLGTATMFGGGTLAVVSGPGALAVRTVDRDRVVAAIAAMAPGNAVAFVQESRSSDRRKGPTPKRLVDAVRDAGGTIAEAWAPRPSDLAGWLERDARDRGLRLAPGAAATLADRLGARVTDGDVERRHLCRIAVMELDKLALRHANDGAPVTPDDVRELVAESVPGSVWGLLDAVADRRTEVALTTLDRLIDSTPEPVLVTVLHRRVRELIEVGDRTSAGQAPHEIVAATRLHPFVAEKLQRSASRWTMDELRAALAGLVELDAMSKGVPGHVADVAQRRLAFTVWVRDHTTGSRQAG